MCRSSSHVTTERPLVFFMMRTPEIRLSKRRTRSVEVVGSDTSVLDRTLRRLLVSARGGTAFSQPSGTSVVASEITHSLYRGTGRVGRARRPGGDAIVARGGRGNSGLPEPWRDVEALEVEGGGAEDRKGLEV